MAEITHEYAPLNAPNQQTEVNVEAQPQGSRSTRAYKIAGITFLVAVLIVGQGVITYFLISQKGDLKSLEQDNNNLQSEMTKSRSASQSISRPVNSLPLLMDDTADQGFAAENPAPQQKTKCQQADSGKKAMPLPGFSPVCDEHGLYERQQCWKDVCWCVNPDSGEMIADTMQSGNAFCSESLSAGFASPFA